MLNILSFDSFTVSYEWKLVEFFFLTKGTNNIYIFHLHCQFCVRRTFTQKKCLPFTHINFFLTVSTIAFVVALVRLTRNTLFHSKPKKGHQMFESSYGFIFLLFSSVIFCVDILLILKESPKSILLKMIRRKRKNRKRKVGKSEVCV